MEKKLNTFFFDKKNAVMWNVEPNWFLAVYLAATAMF